MKKKQQPISFGRGQVPKFKSVEAQAKYFERLAKAQEREKAEKEGKKDARP
jgi:hypothetical protein